MTYEWVPLNYLPKPSYLLHVVALGYRCINLRELYMCFYWGSGCGRVSAWSTCRARVREVTGVWVIRPSRMIYCEDDEFTKLLHLVILWNFWMHTWTSVGWINYWYCRYLQEYICMKTNCFLIAKYRQTCPKIPEHAFQLYSSGFCWWIITLHTSLI